MYFSAAGLCALCAWRAGREPPGNDQKQHRLYWSGLAAGLLILGINKQLDLQSWAIGFGREVVQSSGLAPFSQSIQVFLIVAMALVACVGLFVLLWWMRGQWRYTLAALLGAFFLARFVIVRAAGFLGVPLPELSNFTGGLRLNFLLEIAGATIIAIAAWYNMRHNAIK